MLSHCRNMLRAFYHILKRKASEYCKSLFLHTHPARHVSDCVFPTGLRSIFTLRCLLLNCFAVQTKATLNGSVQCILIRKEGRTSTQSWRAECNNLMPWIVRLIVFFKFYLQPESIFRLSEFGGVIIIYSYKFTN